MQDETERTEPERAESETDDDTPGQSDAKGAADENGGEADAPDAATEDDPELDAAEDEEIADTGEDEAEYGDAALKNQLLRALADAENTRRRAKKDVEDARNYAISRFAQDLLGVADNLGRALESIPADKRESDDAVKALAEGVEMTAREFETALGRHGITRIDPLGEKFDYNLHQALFETDQTDQPDGTVVQVLQTGYRIGDRLLREAMVGVAKGGTPPAADDEADPEVEAEAETGSDGADAPADEPS
ncbi:MAG: nucleotide exchange factor GrpE [Rhodospirillaceae bacterium]|nr:nucleotide exchange factor GrpE [Rhodospirillaceae bacterium]